MRRFLFLLAPLGIAAFSFACEDDPTNNQSPGFPEAGAFDSNRPPTDSSTPDPDASPDAPSAPKGVTVVATGRTGPASNITVLFHDATGAITETKKTGADGKATSVPSPTPAMATIIFGESTIQRRLLTWTAVADGDELPAIVPEELDLGSVDVTLANPPDAGSFGYYSHVGGCDHYAGFGGEPWTNPVSQGCARGGGALLVRATDDSDVTQAFAFKKPIALDPDGGTVAATPGAWLAPVTITLNVSNTTNSSGIGVFSQLVGNTVFRSRISQHDRHFIGDTFSTTFHGAGPTFADGYNASAIYNGSNPNNERIIGKRFPTSTTNVTLDANTLPPELTGSSLDETDKRRPIAKWTGSTTGLKGGIVRLFYFNVMADGETTGWTLVVPPTATEVKVPALPASLDTILPSPDGGLNTWDPSPKVAFADSTLLPDYGTFRKIQGVVFPTIDEDAQLEDVVLPQAGDFKITSWYVNNSR